MKLSEVTNEEAASLLDDAAGDVASSIYGHYCNLGLSAVEREVFISEVFQRLADILEHRDGEKIHNKASDRYKDLVADEQEYDAWTDDQIEEMKEDVEDVSDMSDFEEPMGPAKEIAETILNQVSLVIQKMTPDFYKGDRYTDVRYLFNSKKKPIHIDTKVPSFNIDIRGQGNVIEELHLGIFMKSW